MHAGGVVTLTSSAQGAICPGEEVTLTCIVVGGVILEWRSEAFNPFIRYTQFELGVVVVRGVFTATLTSVTPNSTILGSLNFVSTLRVTATPEAMLNGTVITCSDGTNPISTTLTLAGNSTTKSHIVQGVSGVLVMV